MNELWKPIAGYLFYEVSNKGRVRSLPHLIPYKGGIKGFTSRKPGKILMPVFAGLLNNKYHAVNLYKNGKKKTRKIHQLVLEAFIGPKPSGFYGCHNDGDKSNNFLSNLRWDTPKSNSLDSKRHGTRRYGEKINFSKLTSGCIERILDMSRFCMQKDIAQWFEVSPSTIQHVLSGRIWGHITGFEKRISA